MNDLQDEYYEAELHKLLIEPLWAQPLFQAVNGTDFVDGVDSLLIAENRCGYGTAWLVNQVGEDTRIVALEPSRAMVDQARQRMEELTDRRIFFNAKGVTGLPYADQVFDGTMCINGLSTVRLLQLGLLELTRVTTLGGKVLIAVPLAGAFDSVYDLFEEALRERQLGDTVERMYALRQDMIGYSHLSDTAQECGLYDAEIREIGWEISFASGRDLSSSPLLGSLFMSYWLGTLRAEDRGPVLECIENAVDCYWTGSQFTTTVRAACLTARR